jgi:membrane protein implicated in regulation of membrane protease activity
LEPHGQVFVRGALWRARTAEQHTTLAAGERVEIDAVDGLTLRARRPAPDADTSDEGNAR